MCSRCKKKYHEPPLTFQIILININADVSYYKSYLFKLDINDKKLTCEIMKIQKETYINHN